MLYGDKFSKLLQALEDRENDKAACRRLGVEIYYEDGGRGPVTWNEVRGGCKNYVRGGLVSLFLLQTAMDLSTSNIRALSAYYGNPRTIDAAQKPSLILK